MATVAQRMREALALRGMKQADLVEKTGIGKSSISTYLTGEYLPKQKNMYLIAHALHVNEAWLMGQDVPMTRVADPTIPRGYEAIPPMTRIPLRGNIACGVPILAIEDVSEYVNLPQGVVADFALRCKGDSMIGARILDGDIVYIRAQPDVENGEIAAVEVDGEATLKRVYKVYVDGRVHVMELRAENPNMQPIILAGDKLSSVRIDGKAVWFASLVR